MANRSRDVTAAALVSATNGSSVRAAGGRVDGHAPMVFTDLDVVDDRP